MKKLFILVAIATLGLGFYSCDKDKDEERSLDNTHWYSSDKTLDEVKAGNTLILSFKGGKAYSTGFSSNNEGEAEKWEDNTKDVGISYNGLSVGEGEASFEGDLLKLKFKGDEGEKDSEKKYTPFKDEAIIKIINDNISKM